MNPDYPIYIISKGRWKNPLTVKSLERMKVPYHIVIEPQEYDNYASVVDPNKIYVLPFSNLGQGSIPARNWVWDHSVNIGAKRHWILDDNVEAFNRLNRNIKPVVLTGSLFKAAEDFTDRYENVALSGFNYYSFCKSTDPVPPFYLNTRVYSCILIKNDLPYKWRGRYNEDTDLSLRVLKDGFCTIQFNAFLQQKATTQTLKGGNTDAFYAKEGTLPKSQMLVDMHPDVSKVVWRFNRHHHEVNYRKFKANQLIRKEGLLVKPGINHYGMKLI